VIRKLFSKEQRAFFTADAPEGLGLDDLTMLGPINLMKLKSLPGFQVAAETRAFLAAQGVYLSGEQHTKTKTALQYFSQNLTAAATS
jgi:hypothetical protein